MTSDIMFRSGDEWSRSSGSAWRASEPSRCLRVVIYGEHSPDWMTALAPGAAVWTGMPDVDEVLLVPDRPGVVIPEPRHGGTRTVVIPLMEDHTRHCPPHYLSLVPDHRSIDVLADKAAFADYVRTEGLGELCPETYESAADAVFPCVLKRANLNAGQGVVIARSLPDLMSRLAQEPWAGHTCILQSLEREPVEYVTHCVCRDGRILWHCTFAYEADARDLIRTANMVNPVRPVAASASGLEQIETLLVPLGYCGPCNVDYKISNSGKLAVFEINPRLGGSLMRPENVDYLQGALSCIIEAALRRQGDGVRAAACA
jgi:hypothetical protein